MNASDNPIVRVVKNGKLEVFEWAPIHRYHPKERRKTVAKGKGGGNKGGKTRAGKGDAGKPSKTGNKSGKFRENNPQRKKG
ncbi:hypothetical protein C6499_19275 [Candidatus Poribacteria bacterium]|nr:MAG: hypothetical protein C6499_19275 [Candidatus Poribacteria bacterium]